MTSLNISPYTFGESTKLYAKESYVGWTVPKLKARVLEYAKEMKVPIKITALTRRQDYIDVLQGRQPIPIRKDMIMPTGLCTPNRLISNDTKSNIQSAPVVRHFFRLTQKIPEVMNLVKLFLGPTIAQLTNNGLNGYRSMYYTSTEAKVTDRKDMTDVNSDAKVGVKTNVDAQTNVDVKSDAKVDTIKSGICVDLYCRQNSKAFLRGILTHFPYSLQYYDPESKKDLEGVRVRTCLHLNIDEYTPYMQGIVAMFPGGFDRDFYKISISTEKLGKSRKFSINEFQLASESRQAILVDSAHPDNLESILTIMNNFTVYYATQPVTMTLTIDTIERAISPRSIIKSLDRNPWHRLFRGHSQWRAQDFGAFTIRYTFPPIR